MGFAEQFMQGLMMGRAEQERKKQQALAEQWHQQQADMQRKQFERQGILDQQGQAKDILGLLQSQPMPREEMPAGQAGPPAPAPRPQISIPLLGGGAQQITPQYAEDVAAQQRAAEDAKRSEVLDLFRQQEQIRNEADKETVTPDSPLVKYGITPGVYTGKQLDALKQFKVLDENIAARHQAAADAKAQRDALQAQKDAEKQAAIQALIDKAKEGQYVEMDRGTKNAAAQAASAQGVKLLTKKEGDEIDDLNKVIDQARAALNAHSDAYTGLEARLTPDVLIRDPKRREFLGRLGQLTSYIRHDVSGAAVSKTELPYLKTWLPEAGDNDPTVRQKLETLARTAEEKKAAIMGQKAGQLGSTPAAPKKLTYNPATGQLE